MLNKAERFKVLKVFKICCIAGLLPIQVDLASWQLKVPSKIKRCVCVLFFSTFVLHVLYKLASLVYVYFFDPNVQLHQLVIHALMVMAPTLTALWYVKVYISDPELLAAYFNITLLGNVGGPRDYEDECLDSRPPKRLREQSLHDLIALNLPCIMAPVIPFILAAYIYDPSMKLLLFAALPEAYQTWTTFGLCLMEEFRILVVILVTVVPIWQMQVISFDLLSNKLKLLIRTMQNGRLGPRSIYKCLRCFQLYVTILNKFNSDLVFTGKLLCIGGTIMCGYAAVAHFLEHPIFGVMYYALLLDYTMVYTVMYEKAFKIPQLFEQASVGALMHMSGRRGRSVFRKQILSVAPCGIKVGRFHTLERASTLIFMDFVLRNIVNLLVVYG